MAAAPTFSEIDQHPGSGIGIDAHVSTAGSTGEGGISSPMVAALEQAWSAIRTRHPEIPAVVIVLGGGSDGRPGTLKLGHFAALRWTTNPTDDITGETSEEQPLGEVFVGGEGLALGPVDVLGTLLHEAAHALADVRRIKDTSRQGRWHNAKFKALAEELGIEVTKDPKLGWSPTTVSDTARDDYTDLIAQLGQALRMKRAIDGVGFGLGPSSGGQTSDGEDGETVKDTGAPKGPLTCQCSCSRRIRVAPTVLAMGPIICGVCKQPFDPPENDTRNPSASQETTPTTSS